MTRYQTVSYTHLDVYKRQGYNNGEWILLDYIDYVIHVFDREQRLFYDIERIWSDGKEIEVK